MAGYLFKKFFNGTAASNATTTLFTVPAGHVYIIKQGVVNTSHNAASQGSGLRVNDKKVVAYITNGADEVIADLCSGGLGSNGKLYASNSIVGSAKNLVLEAGDTLKWVNGKTDGTCDVHISGIDFTI